MHGLRSSHSSIAIEASVNADFAVVSQPLSAYDMGVIILASCFSIFRVPSRPGFVESFFESLQSLRGLMSFGTNWDKIHK